MYEASYYGILEVRYYRGPTDGFIWEEGRGAGGGGVAMARDHSRE